jgi:hypothetical protein
MKVGSQREEKKRKRVRNLTRAEGNSISRTKRLDSMKLQEGADIGN